MESTRRSLQISLALPIQVAGTDASGQTFNEMTRTVVIARHGATIALSRELSPMQEVTIRHPRTGLVSRARIVAKAVVSHNDKHYGCEILDRSVNLWGIYFPPAEESEAAPGRVLLECMACHKHEVVCLDELSIEVFLANRRISRPCTCSGSNVPWSEVTNVGVPRPPHCSPQVGSSIRTQNERTNARQAVNVTGCVKTAAYGEELVTTENLSAGGICFKSEHRYKEGERVEVALPYKSGGGNVFVPARIVWAQTPPEGGAVIYGVNFRKVRRAERYVPTAGIPVGILGAGVRLSGKVVNLSMTGVLVRCSKQLESGTHVKLGIEVESEVFSASAVARRSLPGVGTAFEFTQVSQNDRMLLRRVIYRLSKSVEPRTS